MAIWVNKVFSDSSLYGHCLTNLPEKTWDALTGGDLLLYKKSDPGCPQMRKNWIFEDYTIVKERYPNGNIKEVLAGTNFLPAKYLELAIRWVGGAFFTVTLCLTAAPLGFAIKTIHLLGMQLQNS